MFLSTIRRSRFRPRSIIGISRFGAKSVVVWGDHFLLSQKSLVSFIEQLLLFIQRFSFFLTLLHQRTKRTNEVRDKERKRRSKGRNILT